MDAIINTKVRKIRNDNLIRNLVPPKRSHPKSKIFEMNQKKLRLISRLKMFDIKEKIKPEKT